MNHVGFIARKNADVAELVYAYVSEAYGAILEGSSPSVRTRYRNKLIS